jgi:hypothetical protein
VQYIGANVPQAWAAGTPFVLLQSMLGIVPDAPRGRFYVDPAFPDWMPDVTLIDLRLGRKTMDLRFWCDGAAPGEPGAFSPCNPHRTSRGSSCR